MAVAGSAVTHTPPSFTSIVTISVGRLFFVYLFPFALLREALLLAALGTEFLSLGLTLAYATQHWRIAIH